MDGFAFRTDVFQDWDYYRQAVIGIVFTHFLHLYMRRQQLIRYRFGAAFLKLWASVLVTSLLITITYTVIAVFDSGGWATFYASVTKAADKKLGPDTVLTLFFLATWFLWHLVIWGWLIIYFMILQGRFKRMELESENRLRQAELENLKTKLNPHFLFNALSSIRSLIGENPQRAQQAVGELADVLRSAILAEHQQQISFERELEVVQHYLAIEKIRFEERLQVQYDIDPAIYPQPMPPMLLQTLVENAIKHGISKKTSGGNIRIRAGYEHGHCFIRVENSGQITTENLQNGFGITGTIKRLSLLYGNEASFSIRNADPQTVHATVKLPKA